MTAETLSRYFKVLELLVTLRCTMDDVDKFERVSAKNLQVFQITGISYSEMVVHLSAFDFPSLVDLTLDGHWYAECESFATLSSFANLTRVVLKGYYMSPDTVMPTLPRLTQLEIRAVPPTTHPPPKLLLEKYPLLTSLYCEGSWKGAIIITRMNRLSANHPALLVVSKE
jgi:hypothetical protein